MRNSLDSEQETNGGKSLYYNLHEKHKLKPEYLIHSLYD